MLKTGAWPHVVNHDSKQGHGPYFDPKGLQDVQDGDEKASRVQGVLDPFLCAVEQTRIDGGMEGEKNHRRGGLRADWRGEKEVEQIVEKLG